ncbi:kinase-like protein [Lyophyllum atratum]|nr:kinase-like protein [Lyophyllum atratum]
MEDLPPGVFRVCGKFRLKKKIGAGAFGDVYLAEDVITGAGVAVKMEPPSHNPSKLRNEWKIYKDLGRAPGIPRAFWFDVESGYKAIVMSLLGPSLEEIFNTCNRVFSLKTVLLVAEQMITRIEYLHARGYIHRDIKPDNFLLGPNGNAEVHIVDFGLAMKYHDDTTHSHISCQKTSNILGTARYFSIHTHQGFEQSHRDDLESLAYVLIYFLRGTLPWQNLEGKTQRQKYSRILRVKLRTSSAELCSGLPDELRIFLDYARNLAFEDTPDYQYIRHLFSDAFYHAGYMNDHVFDWTGKLLAIDETGQESMEDAACQDRCRLAEPSQHYA